MQFASQVTNTQELRILNQYKLLQALYFNDPSNRHDLCQRTGLSMATITNLVSDLLETEVIVETGTEKSSGGRPRVILAVNEDFGNFIGIDLGETHIRFDLFSVKMNLIKTVTYWLDEGPVEAQEVVEKIVAGYQTLMTDSSLPEEKIIGIGIGVPGVVERDGGISIFAPNWGWQNISLLAELQKKITRPITMDNGAKAMSLAEMWFGTGQGSDNLIALLLGTGIGTGIVWNGLVMRGVTNSAGEWGHTTLKLDGRSCRCGGQGCLETYIGATGIIQTLQDNFPDSSLLISKNQLNQIKNIASAAKQGDKIAHFVISETTRYLGAGIANLINLYNPHTIILGGWVSSLFGSYFIEQLPEILARYALQQPLDATNIKISCLGENAISMGAACLVLTEFLNGERLTY